MTRILKKEEEQEVGKVSLAIGLSKPTTRALVLQEKKAKDRESCLSRSVNKKKRWRIAEIVGGRVNDLR